MAKPDPLFQLVKAMTRTEKRYFKLKSKQQSTGRKDYLRLFDAIDAQKEYDEDAIRKKFRNEPYFRQLKSVKSYLHRQIMKSLKNFYDDSSGNIKANNYLTEIEILYNKELYSNCANAIKKARAYTEKHEKFTHLLKVMEWEISIADHTHDLHQVELLKKEVVNEARKVIKKYDESTELVQLYLESRNIMNVLGEGRIPEEMKWHDNIIKHKLLQHKADSFRGERFRLVIEMHRAQLKRDHDALSSAMKNMQELFDTNPHQIEEYTNAYFDNLAVLTIGSMMAKKFIAAKQMISKLKNIYQKNNDRLSLLNKIRLLHIEVYSLIVQGEFTQALSFIPRIKSLLENEHHELDLTARLYLYFLGLHIYFRNKDHKNIQYYIHKIVNPDTEVLLDMQSSARIINLIVQYEQHEYDHLGYVLRSTYRYLMKKQRLHKPEVIILDFLKRIMKFTSEKQLLNALSELKEELLAHKTEPLISDFSLIEWMDSKLQKKELAEIMKEGYWEAVAKEESNNK